MGADWRGGRYIWHAKVGEFVLQVSGIHAEDFRWGIFNGASPYAIRGGKASDLDAAKKAAEAAIPR